MSITQVMHSSASPLDRIIWAEDNFLIRKDLQDLLSSFGIPQESILLPMDGEDLIAIARENYARCPIIFTDNSMPNSDDGIRAVKEIRQFYLPPRPIFLVSGDINPLNKRSISYIAALNAGVSDCILKPYRIEVIEALLNQHCPHLISPQNR